MDLKEVYASIGMIADGKTEASTLFKLQCQRHLNDLPKAKDKNWFFDEPEAQKYLNFFNKVARHSKDRWAGKPFQMQPFQAIMIAMLFGWKAWSDDLDDYSRRFTTLLFDIARKNGKTELIAAIANAVMIYSLYGCEIYCCATKRDQAMTTFKFAKNQMRFMQRHSATLRRKFKCRKYAIENVMEDGILEPVSSDHNSLDGLSPVMAIIDEYHAHKTSAVLDVMETGQGSRWDGPILAVTTTAGFNQDGPCYEFRKNAIGVLQGEKTDDRLLPCIHAMDEEDDWNDEKNWYKSNPNLGVSTSLEFLRGQYQKALNEGPTKQRQFKTKNLNLWVDAEQTWIEKSVWKQNAKLTDRKHYAKLHGKRCYGALDLSSTRDLTSLSLVFPIQPGLDRPHVIAYHFCPQNRVRALQRRGFSHKAWEKEGWLSSTRGDVIDDDAVKTTVLDCKKKFKFKQVAFDRWGAKNVVTPLMKTGIEFVEHGQGFRDMNEPTKAFEKAVYGPTPIEHFGNPVLTWQIGNTVVRTDPAGNIKPDKEKGERQIDGVVATIMAWGLMVKGEQRASAYAKRGVRSA